MNALNMHLTTDFSCRFLCLGIRLPSLGDFGNAELKFLHLTVWYQLEIVLIIRLAYYRVDS